MADNVELDIKINTDDAISSVKKLENVTDKSVSAMEKSFGALKVAAAAAVAFFAGREVIQFFESGIDAAIKQQDALSKLSLQLALTGEASDDAVSSFADFADELERTTKFEDDQILAAASLAKTFGVTNDQAKDLVKTATELSAATGKDLTTSVNLLGKSYSGVLGPLDELDNSLKGLTKEQLKNGDAVKILGERYRGLAENETKTFSGALLQTEKAFGNLQEAFGKAITENGAVRNTISLLGSAFEKLEKAVKDNQGVIDAFITGGVKLLAATVPIAIDVLGVLIQVFQKLVIGVEGLFFGFLKLVEFMQKTVGKALFEVADAILQIVEVITDGVKNTPLLAKGLSAIGVNAEESASGIKDLRSSLTSFYKGEVKGIEDLQDSTVSFAKKTINTFDSFNKGYDSVGKSIKDTANEIEKSDNKIAKSAVAASKARGDFARSAGLTADEIAKLNEEVKKFEKTLFESGATELQKLSATRDEQLKQIENFEKQRVITAEKGVELRLKIDANFASKSNEIQSKQLKEQVANAKKAADETRAIIEKAAADPISFAVAQIKLPPLDISQSTKELAGLSAGVLSKILDGAAGAKSIISSGIGAFADAFIPGIGGAITGIVNKLAEGPDAVKKFVTEFVDSIPQLIQNIADSIPAVVEALVDSLLTKGGLAKIIQALAKASPQITVAIAKAGPLIAVEMAKAGPSILIEMVKAGPSIAFDMVKSGPAIAFEMIRAAPSIAQGFYYEFIRIFKWPSLPEFKWPPLPVFSWPELPKFSWPSLPSFSWPSLPTFSWPSFPTFRWPDIPEPGWVSDIKNITGGGGGGGGGAGGLISRIQTGISTGGGSEVKRALGFADGGVIPTGFPNDRGLALVQSKERVLSPSQTESFEKLVNMLPQLVAGGGGQPVTVNLQVGEAQLAKVMLNLNRQGFRVA